MEVALLGFARYKKDFKEYDLSTGIRVCKEEYMNKLKNGDIVKTFVYNYMFIKGSTEEEALNNQEEKTIFSLEVCQSFLQASQDNLQCSHDRKGEISELPLAEVPWLPLLLNA